jgi:hypothetical protein
MDEGRRINGQKMLLKIIAGTAGSGVGIVPI